MGKRRCRAKWRWTEWEGIRGARQLGWTLDAYPYLLLLTFSSLHSPFSKSPLTQANLYANNNVLAMACLFPSFVLKVPSLYSYTVELEPRLAIHQHPFSRRRRVTILATKTLYPLPVENQTPSSYLQIKPARRQPPNPQGQVRKRVRSTDILNTALSPSSPRPAC